MFTTEVGGTTYAVKFEYGDDFEDAWENPPEKFHCAFLKSMGGPDPDIRHITRCAIIPIKPGQNSEDVPDSEITKGYAYRTPADKFVKHVGRKYALEDALKKTNFTKEQRTKFWNNYLTKTAKRYLKN